MPVTMTVNGKASAYTAEIQAMMYGFGDCRRPLAETAAVIEDVVKQQMTEILLRAADVAEARGSKAVGLEEVVFLMRKNPIKIQRLIEKLRVIDMSNQQRTVDLGAKSSRLTRCVDFLQSINTDSQLDAALNGDLVDESRIERLKRLDRLSRDLDERKYAEFIKARQVNFVDRGKKVGKGPFNFQEWVMQDVGMDIKVDKSGFDILAYLAFETVGLLVDMAVLMKRESLAPGDDVVSRVKDPVSMNHQFPSIQLPQVSGSIDPVFLEGDKKKGKTESDLILSPITPSEVREAVRRLYQRENPFQWFCKSDRWGANTTLIAI